MHAEWSLPLSSLYSFLMVLARMGGIFVFVPLPGFRTGPEIPRIALALTSTLCLYPRWPELSLAGMGIARLAGWLVMETALGITAGLAVAFVSEAMLMMAQVTGLQAGYAYASMIDPSTEADSSVLLMVAQLTAGLLFFACGLDREVIRICARSLETCPPGTFALSPAMGEGIVRLGSGMFVVGLRLAMPVLALMVLVDVALALLGRLNQQLQLLTMAFPAKMLAALAVLCSMAALFPRLYRAYAGEALAAVSRFFFHGG